MMKPTPLLRMMAVRCCLLRGWGGSFRRGTGAWVLGGAMLWPLSGCHLPEIGDEPVTVEVRELPPGVADAYRRLTAGSSSLAERTSAAATLLAIDDFAADRALAASLGQQQLPEVWRAVLQAVAIDPDEPPRGLWRPMATMLYHADDTLVTDVGMALSRFSDPALLGRLTEAAESSDLPERERRRAIAALGHQRSREVAGRLVSLTAISQPAAIQSAAYKALATLTGLDELDADRRAWADWWDRSRKLDPLAWQRQLVNNFARKLAMRRSNDQQLAEKLRVAERALYQALSPTDQANVLTYMLESEVAATRSLALDLAQTRLVQDVAFEQPLRRALRARLNDSSADLRRRAALILRDLADEAAADAVGTKLIERQEGVNSVVSAYLQLLSRMPRKSVTEAAYDLLEEPGLRSDAAAVLAAIARSGQLPPKHAAATAQRLRGYLNDGQRATPQVIALLGLVGSNDDWQRIQNWIGDPDEVTRQAAAQAWADSDRSLAVLAERADDPIIQPIVIVAATQRGQDPSTLRMLTDNRPSQPQFVPAWERALLAMAGRVTPSVSLDTIEQLDALGRDLSLRERFLTAALERGPEHPDLPPGPYLQLLLERAETRLQQNSPELAAADFERLLERVDQLHANERERLYRGLIPAYLASGRYEPATAAARAFFEDPANPGSIDPAATDDPLMDTFLTVAHREADLGRPEPARQIFDGLRLLLGPSPSIPPALAQKMTSLEQKLTP